MDADPEALPDDVAALKAALLGAQAMAREAVAHLQAYMLEQRAKLSRGHDLAKAFSYMLRRWPSFTRFLEDGRICLSTDVVEKPKSPVLRPFPRAAQ